MRPEARGAVRELRDMAAYLSKRADAARTLSRDVERAVARAYDQGYADGFGECAALMAENGREAAERA